MIKSSMYEPITMMTGGVLLTSKSNRPRVSRQINNINNHPYHSQALLLELKLTLNVNREIIIISSRYLTTMPMFWLI